MSKGDAVTEFGGYISSSNPYGKFVTRDSETDYWVGTGVTGISLSHYTIEMSISLEVLKMKYSEFNNEYIYVKEKDKLVPISKIYVKEKDELIAINKIYEKKDGKLKLIFGEEN